MGRVYNALVRAERVSDPNRPIGRPERNGAAAGRAQGIAPGSLQSASPANSATSVAEDYLALPEGPVTSAFSGSPVVMPSTQAKANAKVPAPAARPAVRLPSRAVSKVKDPSARTIAFEEPSKVLSIRDLAIDRHVAALTGDDLLATERYRTLAMKLLNLTDQRKIKTVLITSAQAGDGKTTVATGTAWSLAKIAERRVLLIDASTTSSVGRMLGIEPRRGLVNLLGGSSELKEAVVRLEPNGLYVLTAGAQSGAPSLGAWSVRLESLIADLASRFDLVIVDSGSIVDSPETQRLATVLGGTVIVARANHTHHDRVSAARKLVPKERRLGIVLNESVGNAPIAHQADRRNGVMGRLFGRRK